MINVYIGFSPALVATRVSVHWSLINISSSLKIEASETKLLWLLWQLFLACKCWLKWLKKEGEKKKKMGRWGKWNVLCTFPKTCGFKFSSLIWWSNCWNKSAFFPCAVNSRLTVCIYCICLAQNSLNPATAGASASAMCQPPQLAASLALAAALILQWLLL